MTNDITSAVAAQFPDTRRHLEDLVRIPSVSAAGFDPGEVRRSANATAALLEGVGLQQVRLLELEGANPADNGEHPAPPGAPNL